MLETDIYCTRYAWCSVPTNACREVAISSLATLAVVLGVMGISNGCSTRAEPANDKSATAAPDRSRSERASVSVIRRQVSADLGVVRPNSKHTAVFSVENDTSNTWELNEFLSSCGCAVLSSEWESIPPGESRDVRVLFTAPSAEGRLSKQMIVKFRSKSAPLIELRLTANVLSAVSVFPDELEFVFKNKDNVAKRMVSVRNSGDKKWLELTPKRGKIPLEFAIVEVLDGDSIQEFDIAVSLDSSLLHAAEFRETVRLFATIEESESRQEIEVGYLPVRVSIRDALEVQPKSIVIGVVPPSRTVRSKLLVAVNGDVSLTSNPALGATFKVDVSSAEVQAEVVSVKKRAKNLFDIEVEFQFRTTQFASSLSASIACDQLGLRSQEFELIVMPSKAEEGSR